MDETENAFVWEHIQSSAEQAHGAWLGVSVKGHESLFPLLFFLELAPDQCPFAFVTVVLHKLKADVCGVNSRNNDFQPGAIFNTLGTAISIFGRVTGENYLIYFSLILIFFPPKFRIDWD